MTVVVHVRRVWKSLGGRIVLRDLDLSLEEGERLVLLGANGSGKSTLLHLVAGVLDPDDGEVWLAPGTTFGFAPEKPDLAEHLLVGEWIDTMFALRGRGAAALDADFGTAPLLRRPIGALSLGQRQRVSLASAWLGDPTVLVLDEPTNALDAESREQVIERLRRTTAIVATHDREVAERIGTRIVRMRSSAA